MRAVGVSCHDVGALKVAAAHPWVDVFIARINNVGKDAEMDGSPEEVAPILKQARANGKVVVGMKLFGAGKLAKPDQMDASLRYVFQNQLVDAVTIGMMKPKEVDDTIRRIDKALSVITIYDLMSYDLAVAFNDNIVIRKSADHGGSCNLPGLRNVLTRMRTICGPLCDQSYANSR